MAKILGLDLGTNSIGWAVVDMQRTTIALYKRGSIFSNYGSLVKGPYCDLMLNKTNKNY